MKQLLLTLVAILTAANSFAQDFEVGGISYTVLSEREKTCEVARKRQPKYSGHIAIPETVTHDGKTYTVTAIGDEAFYRCKNLKNIEIPNSVTTIGDEVFFRCARLKTVTIGSSVQEIGDEAFFRCARLKTVTIGNSVRKIGDDAFYGCKRIAEINLQALTPPAIDSETFGEVNLKKTTLKVPTPEAYKKVEGWKDFKNIVRL